MNSNYSYTTQYTLDKSHFSECFDESVPQNTSLRGYLKPIILFLIGTSLLLVGFNGYASWFLIVLSVLDALSVYYKKPWWLMRQMMSKAANNEVTLTLDEQGISNDSFYVNGTILWQDIVSINETSKGFLIKQARGVSYLSKRSLDETAKEFVKTKAKVNP